ncbi:MAG: PEGA domain-containing protein [Myxococcales bacterium]|nr:PEGA domain-containing protein [Myxococcales bacterium]
MPLLVFWLFFVGIVLPASAADPTGVVKLSASAPGAEVYLDGSLIGATPLTKYLTVGTHRLRIVADNFEPFVRQIEVQADKTLELAAAMTPGPGSVEFSGAVGTTVSVGGHTYPVPVRLPSPGTGSLVWRGQAPDFEAGEGTLPLVKGRNYLVTIALESSMGVVAVTSKPAGATVRLDGKELGVTPVKVRDIAPGVHGVEVSLDGYATTYKKLDTAGGVRGTLDVALNKGGAELVVSTTSADATVFLNGVEVGRGTTVKVAGVGGGKTEVTVTTGTRSVSGKVVVPSSGSVLARATDNTVVETKPLTRQWGFWAAVGGGAVAAGTTAAVVVAANQPAPAPEGDVVVTLP